MSLFPLRLIPHTTNFNFMRVRWVSIGIAALLAIAAIGAIVVKNFNFALDFTGGTVVELRFQTPPNVDGVRERLEAGGYGSAQVQTFGTGSDLLVRLQPREDAGTAAGAEASDRTAQDVLRLASSEGNQATVMRSEFVGPQVGKELALNGLYTLLFVVVGFLIYIAVRFEWKFAVSAIATTLADVLIVAGFFAFSGIEFDLTFLTVLALYLYGGGSLEGMALSQMIGIVLGTISSIFVACPLLTIGFLKVTKQDLMPKAKDEALLARRP